MKLNDVNFYGLNRDLDSAREAGTKIDFWKILSNNINRSTRSDPFFSVAMFRNNLTKANLPLFEDLIANLKVEVVNETIISEYGQ